MLSRRKSLPNLKTALWGTVEVFYEHTIKSLSNSKLFFQQFARTSEVSCFPIYLVSLRLEDWQGCDLSRVLLFWLGLGCLLLPLLSVRSGHQLNSILLTFHNQRLVLKSVFSTNAQSRFGSVVFDGDLGPPRLARPT